MSTANLLTLHPLATADLQRYRREAAQALRRWRCAMGWSREQAGAWLGADPATVWRWETGRTGVPGDVLMAIGERRAA